MPHYFFHIRKAHGKIHDDEGISLANETEARAEAIEAARDLLVEGMRGGKDLTDQAFIIADENGHEVMTVPFSEAVGKLDNK